MAIKFFESLGFLMSRSHYSKFKPTTFNEWPKKEYKKMTYMDIIFRTIFIMSLK